MSTMQTDSRQEVSAVFGDTPEASRSDFPVSRSRRASLSSSRFSSRLSRRSSVRDEIQTLDEFLRKQRVIRYMQEERERAARTKVLREEQDAWVEFRADERADRLKYMTEQEIAELLQREADELVREKSMADMASKRASEDAVRRRQSLADTRRKDDELASVRRKSEAEAEDARKSMEREAMQKQLAMAQAEDARRVSLELRQREEDLLSRNRALEDQLADAKRASEEAVRELARAKGDLTDAKRKAEKEKATAHTSEKQSHELQRQINDLQKQLDDVNGRMSSADIERRKLMTRGDEKDGVIASLEAQLEAAKSDREKMSAAPAENGVLKPLTEELEREQRARHAAENRAAEMEEQLENLQKQLNDMKAKKVSQDRDTVEKLTKAARDSAEEAKHAKSAQNVEREKREKAERELIQAQEALKKEKAARDSESKKVADAEKKGRGTPVASSAGKDTDKKKTEELEKLIAALRSDKAHDASTVQCLKNELRATQEELDHEAAARAKFEELAALAVGNDDRVPREEYERSQRDLKRIQQQRDEARQETKATKEDAAKELSTLREWAARLNEQQKAQLAKQVAQPPHVSTDNDFTPRHPTGNGSATPRHGESSRRVVVSSPHQRKEHEKLRKRIRDLEGELLAAKGREKSAGAEAAMAAELSRIAARNKATEEELLRRIEELESENTGLQQRYNNIRDIHKNNDAARAAAEQHVEAQKELIGQLEKEVEQSEERARQAGTSSHQSIERDRGYGAPVSKSRFPDTKEGSNQGTQAGGISDLEERLRKLEEELQKEREARQALEKQLAVEQRQREAAEAKLAAAEKRAKDAEGKAKAANDRYHSTAADNAKKPAKAKSGCC